MVVAVLEAGRPLASKMSNSEAAGILRISNRLAAAQLHPEGRKVEEHKETAQGRRQGVRW